MAPSPSPEPLLDLAVAAVRAAVGADPAPAPLAEGVGALRQDAFVTVFVDGALNGCIGAVGSGEPLGRAIPRLARAAALDDPRLPPLRADQLDRATVEVSVLSPLEPLDVHDRPSLFAALSPGVHGLVVAQGSRRALFLPDVWAQLPDPDDFLDRLLAKAGIAPATWPPGLAASRFTTQAVSRPCRDDRAGAGPDAVTP